VPIKAAQKGVILHAAYLGIYGNCVIIDHGMGVQSLYGHLSSIGVKVGDRVEKGQVIGRSGMTGLAGGDHLHFTMLVGGQQVTPVDWWSKQWMEDRVLRKIKAAGGPASRTVALPASGAWALGSGHRPWARARTWASASPDNECSRIGPAALARSRPSRPRCAARLRRRPALLASPAPAASVTNPVDPATAGAVTGKVSFMGTPPKAETISMSSDPRCMNAGAKTETIMVAGGRLAPERLRLREGWLGNLKFPVPTTALVLDQKGCQYRPHVFGVQAGQPIEILNSDATLHNIHAWPQTNQEFNMGQALQGMKDTHVFTTQEVMVPFRCDVHSG
jgi:plastocyanin